MVWANWVSVTAKSVSHSGKVHFTYSTKCIYQKEGLYMNSTTCAHLDQRVNQQHQMQRGRRHRKSWHLSDHMHIGIWYIEWCIWIPLKPTVLKVNQPRAFCLFSFFSKTNVTVKICRLHWELGLSEKKDGTLTTWPSPRPQKSSVLMYNKNEQLDDAIKQL